MQADTASSTQDGAESDEAQTHWDAFEAEDSKATGDADADDTRLDEGGGAANASQADAVAPADAAATQTQGDAAAEAEPDSKFWEGATPEQKAKWEEAQSKIKNLEHKVRSNSGRIGARTRVLNLLQQSNAAPGGAATTANKHFESDSWKKFETEYGDVAAPLKELVGGVLAQNAKLESQLAAHNEGARFDASEAEAQFVFEQHPDYIEAIGSPEFKKWHDGSPTYIKVGVKRNGEHIVDGQEVSDLIARFKADTAFGKAKDDPSANLTTTAGTTTAAAATQSSALSEQRKQQLQDAASPRATGRARIAQDVPPDDEKGAWDWFERKGL